MATIPWPANLPQLVNEESFDEEIGETLIRSDMDIGPAKVRRRFTHGVDAMSFTMYMTMTQYAYFKNWYKVDLNGGANTIEFNHPVTQVLSVFRFTSPPKGRPLGGQYFNVSMTVELLP